MDIKLLCENKNGGDAKFSALYVCNRKKCKKCIPSCIYTTDKNFSIEDELKHPPGLNLKKR